MNVIKDQDVIQILKEMLNLLDDRLVNHGERVAYLCIKLMHAMNVPEDKYLQVAKLALFHDIGAYKTDEVDAMLGFETEDVWEHAIYGYLFLSRMSPLKQNSDCILYHHIPYTRLMKTGCSDKVFASLIHLCDRIDVAVLQGTPLDALLSQEGNFDPEEVALFKRINKDNQLLQALEDMSYHKEMQELYQSIKLTEEERRQYLEMMAYSIDFKSEFTVLHTIMTTSIAMELGNLYQLNKEELDKLYYGALLHDIGKGAIPIQILEKRGKLDAQELRLMREHVLITERILQDYVQKDILHMAARHHEKLDGSGYPYHLKEEELSLCDRIVAISDILSALLGKRSYKDEFPITKVIEIIEDMAQDHKIDCDVVAMFVNHHEEILQQVHKNTERIRQLYARMQIDYINISEMCLAIEEEI